MNEPESKIFAGSKVRIAFYEWGDPAGQPVFLIHATGFHARCWDQVVAGLPRGFRAIAPDTRGHGRSERTGPMTDWSLAAGDVTELIEHLNLTHAIGVGHSKGGHTLVQAAASARHRFERLLLVDPVMHAPELYALLRSGTSPEEHPVARRRNRWSSWEEMFEHFRNRYPFSVWRLEVLADYCRYGVVPRTDGKGLELACPPEIEASIYLGSTSLDIYELAKTIDMPVTILRAKARSPGDSSMDFASSPTWARAAEAFPRGRDVYLPHLTHFIPMQDPELVTRYIVDPNVSG